MLDAQVEDPGQRSSREYYESMESFDDGIPLNTSYARELTTASQEMGAPALARSSILEVGCGVGRLVPWFLNARPALHGGRDRSVGGALRPRGLQVEVEAEPWQDVVVEPRSFDIVASLHFLEHTAEADVAFEKMVMVARRYVLLVVPEGSDVWNPDHWWMFSQDVLRTWATEPGPPPVRPRAEVRRGAGGDDLRALRAARRWDGRES